MEFEFTKFDVCHFEAYEGWFQDSLLLAALGPVVDQEWLEFVLQDKTGIQFVVHSKNEMVAVVGLAKPTDAMPFWVITDLAVNPMMRRRGIAAGILNELPEIVESQQLMAYVMTSNTNAQQLFHSSGWDCQRLDDEDMFRFVLLPNQDEQSSVFNQTD